MPKYVVYDSATGRIKRFGSTAGSATDKASEPGEVSVEPSAGDFNDITHYWDGTAIADRQVVTATWDTQTIVADGVAVATLSGLPNPAEMVVDGVPATITDGELEVSLSLPKTIEIVLDSPAYQRTEWTIEGT